MYFLKQFDRKLYRSNSATHTTILYSLFSIGRRLSKYEEYMSYTNCIINVNAKVMRVYSTQGNDKLTTTGSPKESNFYGDGASIVIQDEGKQLLFTKTYCAAHSGAKMIEVIENGDFDSIQHIYQIFTDINFIKAVYYKIKSKPSFMTSGVDNKTINDLPINEHFFEQIVKEMKTEKYKPKETKRVLILKKNGKPRPLGIPTIKDRIIQQILKILLETIYDKTFCNYNHGYRPNKGPHTVAENLRTWYGISWFIEGDIVGYFDNIDHQILITIIKKKIKDQQVIDLLWKFLKAGVIIDGKKIKTKKGIPQGGVISPLLSNIYLNEFDIYMQNLKKQIDTKKTSIPNPDYIKKKSKLRSVKIERKKAYQELRAIKSTLRIGAKIYYIRYADDWLIGIWGNKNTAKEILIQIEQFLMQKLKIVLAKEKTKITHAGKEKAKFLGLEINSPTPKKSFYTKTGPKKRASHVRLNLNMPYQQIKNDLMEKGFFNEIKGKWFIKAITKWTNYRHSEILYRYNWIIQGYLNYYSYVDNKYEFHKIIGYILKHSCALTLGRKYKLRSRKKVFKKFGANLKDPENGLELKIPDNFKKTVGKFNNKNKKMEPLKIVEWSMRTQHLLKGPCIGCGTTENLEIHHVKKLKNMKTKGKIGKIMSTLMRKQVPVCKKCHYMIHRGLYNKSNPL